MSGKKRGTNQKVHETCGPSGLGFNRPDSATLSTGSVKTRNGLVPARSLKDHFTENRSLPSKKILARGPLFGKRRGIETVGG